jgi:hypothetical protein
MPRRSAAYDFPLQLRCLETPNVIAAGKTATLVFPLPPDGVGPQPEALEALEALPRA